MYKIAAFEYRCLLNAAFPLPYVVEVAWKKKKKCFACLCFDRQATRGPNVIYILHLDQWVCLTKLNIIFSQPYRHDAVREREKTKQKLPKMFKPHRLQRAESRFHFAAHPWIHSVRGFDSRTSLGRPAAKPPAAGPWFVPGTRVLWGQTAV